MQAMMKVPMMVIRTRMRLVAMRCVPEIMKTMTAGTMMKWQVTNSKSMMLVVVGR